VALSQPNNAFFNFFFLESQNRRYGLLGRVSFSWISNVCSSAGSILCRVAAGIVVEIESQGIQGCMGSWSLWSLVESEVSNYLLKSQKDDAVITELTIVLHFKRCHLYQKRGLLSEN
jgi:hypothetical protein